MRNVCIYHKSVPNSKNLEKIQVLQHFATGVRAAGDKAIDVQDHRYIQSDVGVIQGWISPQIKSGPHIKLRNDVIHNQLKSNKYVVGIDSNLFLYAVGKDNEPHHYLRYSFNGIFPNSGIYCDTIVDPKRWQIISANLGINLKPYRNNGSHILLCLQRNGGWSMGNFDVQQWAIDTITKIRKFSDREIVIRAHPGDKDAVNYLNPNNPKFRLGIKKVRLSTNKNLLDDFRNCWAVVNHNSSPSVAAAIEGLPIFVTDSNKSQCKEIANTDFNFIEHPNLPDRQAWAERISMFHWNFDELRSGECWSHMRNFVQ